MASLRGLSPFQPRPAGVAPAPWRGAPASAVVIPLGLAFVGLAVGILAGIDPKLAIAAAVGLSFAGLVIANVTVGLCLFVVISFLEVLGNVGGSIGATKAFGFLLVASWFAAVSTRNEAENDFTAAHPTMTYLLAIFVAWSGLSMLWAEHGSAALNASFRYLQVLLLFLIIFTAVRKREHAVWMAAAFVSGATVAAVFAIIYHPDPGEYDVARASGTVGDPNELAAVLVAAIILTGVLVVLLKRSPLLRLAAAAAGVICALGLFITFSRGGLVALGCAMIASIFVAGRWRPMIVTTMVSVALVGVAYFALFTPQESRDRITKIDGGTGRTDIWRVGSRMVSAHPVRGVGSGNFSLVSGHYLLRKPGAVKRDFFIREPKVAHNMYLHVLAELGIVGLSLFLAMLGFALACAFKAARRFAEAGDRDMELLTRGLVLAMIGILSADFFLSGQYSKQLWLLLGLAPALLAISTTRARRQALGSF
jgi:putative inorganic carbon (HCO3(-)) transporter